MGSGDLEGIDGGASQFENLGFRRKFGRLTAGLGNMADSC